MLRVLLAPKRLNPQFCRACFCTNKDDSKPKITKEEEKKPSTKNPALDKLNLLLKQIVEDDFTSKKIDLAKPKSRRSAAKKDDTETVKTEAVDNKIVTAVKDVAESIGGNAKQTESELLSKLLNNDQESTVYNLSDIVKGMKIDRDPQQDSTSTSRAFQVKKSLETRKPRMRQDFDGQKPKTRKPLQRTQPAKRSDPVDIFGGEPLGIFTSAAEEGEISMNETWSRLEQRELKLAVTHPPANYFQEMILWTEQGKIWKFPIDNEQGMDEERKVYFADHVFMEQHLEPWCPQKGPLRHFMELVCVGLSKNHYMSVQTKKDHIEWYRNYFESKKDLLKETGALPADTKSLLEIESK